MQYQRLPGTDLNVSRVALGTMTWGEQTSAAEAHRQLDCAIAHGVNFIDTAEMYPVPPGPQTQGNTERILGAWLAKTHREQVIVASKVAGPGRRDWLRGGRTELTRENIVAAADESLQRLRTDYLDLYQIHWPGRNVPMFGATMFDPAKEKEAAPIMEQIEAMSELMRAGKIRAWGLSNETSWGACEFVRLARLHGYAPPATVQNSYSLLARVFDADLAEVCFRNQLKLLPYSPLGGGTLTGKYRSGARPPGARFTLFPDFGPRFRRPRVAAAVEEYAELASRTGLTLVELALGFIMSRWHVGAVLLGASTLEQLQENLAATEVALAAETLADIDAIHARNPSPAA